MKGEGNRRNGILKNHLAFLPSPSICNFNCFLLLFTLDLMYSTTIPLLLTHNCIAAVWLPDLVCHIASFYPIRVIIQVTLARFLYGHTMRQFSNHFVLKRHSFSDELWEMSHAFLQCSAHISWTRAHPCICPKLSLLEWVGLWSCWWSFTMAHLLTLDHNIYIR